MKEKKVEKILMYTMIGLLLLSNFLIWFKIGTYDKANEQLTDYILERQKLDIALASFANTTANGLVFVIQNQHQLRLDYLELKNNS